MLRFAFRSTAEGLHEENLHQRGGKQAGRGGEGGKRTAPLAGAASVGLRSYVCSAFEEDRRRHPEVHQEGPAEEGA